MSFCPTKEENERLLPTAHSTCLLDQLASPEQFWFRLRLNRLLYLFVFVAIFSLENRFTLFETIALRPKPTALIVCFKPHFHPRTGVHFWLEIALS